MKKRLVLWLLLFAIVATLLPAALPLTALAVNEKDKVTRSEWVQQLVATFEMTVEADNYPDNYFSDLTGEEEYYRDIMVAVEFGVVELEAGLPFCPDDPVTRDFAVHTLNYCLGFRLEEEISYTFSDSADVTHAHDAQVAVNRKWLALIAGAFKPDQPITEAEMTAMLADAKRVYFGTAIDPDFVNQVEFKEGVVVVPETTVVTVTDGVVKIPDCQQTITEGTTFVVYINGIPCGYVAQSVAVNENITCVTATEAEDGNVFVAMEMQGTVVPSFYDFGTDDAETELIYVDGYTGTQYNNARAAEAAVNYNAPKGTVFIQRAVGVTKYVELANGQKLRMSMWYKNPVAKYDVSIKDKSAWVTVTGDLEFSYDASVNGALKTKDGKPIEIFWVNIGGIGKFSLCLDVAAAGTIKGSETGELMMGMEYINGDFRLIKEFSEESFSMTMEVTGKIGVTAKLGVTDMPVINAYVYANIGGAGKVGVTTHEKGTPKTCVTFAAYLYAEIGATVKITLFGQLNDTIEPIKLTIFNEKNSPLRVYHHYEDGKEVCECTAGSGGGGSDGGGLKNGYFTPGTSKNWGSGWTGSSGGHGYTKDKKPIIVYEHEVDEDGNATIISYNGSATALNIPSKLDGHPVVAIGESVFEDWTMLRSVNIPDSVTTIGDGAFRNCTNLSHVTLSEKLTTIGVEAFYNCCSLVTVDIPDSVTKISWAAFGNCKNLSRVKLSNNLTEIGGAAFANCTSLKSIVIPDSVTYIDREAFENCTSLKDVKLSKNLEVIDGRAFYNCAALTNPELPKTLREIHAAAFGNTTGLTEIHIPKSLELVGTVLSEGIIGVVYGGPFIGSGLEKATFEEGTTKVCSNLFYGAQNLEEVQFLADMTAIGQQAFYRCTALKEVILPDNITTIEAKAFSECTGITSLHLPKGLTHLGTLAFEKTTSLTEVEIPVGLTDVDNAWMQTAPFGPFEESGLQKATFAEGATIVANDLFNGAQNLTEVVLPKNLKTIEFLSFRKCTSLTTLTLPSSLESIGIKAFAQSGLTEIVLPDSVTSVEESAFASCSNLKKITWSANAALIPKYAMSGCSQLETVVIPEGVTKIDEYGFQLCDALVEVDMPASLKEIKYKAFYDCDHLKSLGSLENVESIGGYCFQNCKAIETFALPQKLTEISKGLFYECTSLKEIVIPEKVTKLNNEVFYNCDALQSINIGFGVKTIGASAFYDCDALETVTMADTVTYIYKGTFEHCDKLKNVTLSRNLKKIYEDTFRECAELEEITIPYYVTDIAANAFNASPKLAKVVMNRNVEKIANSAFSYPDRTVLYVVPRTYPETWAKNNSYKFVANEVPVTSVALEAAELTMSRGSQRTLEMTLTPANTTDVITWRTADEKVVTVDDRGNLEAVGGGETTVMVNVGDQAASIKVNVVNQATSIRLNTQKLTLDGGATYQLQVTIEPKDAVNQDVIWKNSDPKVAAVDENGLVTALTKGTTTITAYVAGLDWGHFCSVTVNSSQYVPDTVDGMESPHDYEANCTDSWKYSIPDAEMLVVTFDEQTELEQGMDFLYIYNAEGKEVGKYTGKTLAGQTLSIDGDTVVVKLKTDAVGNAWGFKITGIEEKHDHKYGNWSVTAASTCTEVGVESRFCEICNLEETREVEALGHQATKAKGKAATCTEAGLTDGSKCSVCGEVLSAQKEIPAAGHKYTDGECTVCGAADPNYKPETQVLRGDMDGNGKVNSDDAIYLLRHTLMASIYPIEQDGDMDGNGKENSDDAIYLLRHTLLPGLYPLH